MANMANIKTVPNQKVVKVNKEPCNKNNLYAAINLQAMEQAAQALDAPSFKLWIYFSKNQNSFEFALSSKDVADTFGMKRDQYNGAIEKLIKKGYLINIEGNRYSFNEIPVVGKSNNEEQSKNALQEKATTSLQEITTTVLQEITTTALQDFPTRNITLNNTLYTTEDTTGAAGGSRAALPRQEEEEKEVTIEPPKAAPSALARKEKKELWRF